MFPLPGGKVVVLKRADWKVRTAPFAVQGVERCQLAIEDFARPQIGNDVMGADQQSMLVGCQAHEHRADRRPAARLKGACPMPIAKR